MNRYYQYYQCSTVLPDQSKEYLTVIKCQDASITPGKLLSSLIYKSPFCIITRVMNLGKNWSSFLWPKRYIPPFHQPSRHDRQAERLIRQQNEQTRIGLQQFMRASYQIVDQVSHRVHFLQHTTDLTYQIKLSGIRPLRGRLGSAEFFTEFTIHNRSFRLKSFEALDYCSSTAPTYCLFVCVCLVIWLMFILFSFFFFFH